ncbi:MAG: protein kinase [Myxococcota bacterium]
MADRLAQQTGITTVNDAQLIAAYRDREDATAYSELVRRHQIPVYRLLTGLLADPDSAEPACEDVFVRAARRLNELPDPEGFEEWLVGLAQELAGERDPADVAFQRVPLDARLTAAQGRKAMGGAVREVLAALPPEQRSVLILADLHGEPVDRIARTLGIPLRIARQRLSAARKGFVAALTEQRRQTVVAPTTAAVLPMAALEERATANLSSPDALVPGYRIVRPLGAGGMGEVFAAEHAASGRVVALKVLAPERAREPGLRQRFEREAIAMQAVRHDNLVELFEHGRTTDGGMFLAMEQLEGTDLFDMLDAGAMESRRAIHVIRHVLCALGALHERGIVHRDVKPENVFIVQHGDDASFAKVFDLGIARLPVDLVSNRGEVRLTQAGMAMGTPAYIAPEQALGAEVDGRADLYAVATMLFELLTGRLPFDGGDAGAMLAMHVSATPPLLTSVAPSVVGAARLEPLLARGLAKQPDDRFDSADAFARTLDEVAGTL